MKNLSIKKFSLRIFLICEILICMGFYFFWSKGYQAIKNLCFEGSQLRSQIAFLKDDIRDLEAEIYALETTPYLREKIAREQLQYAFDGEEIYIVKGY